MKAKIVRGLIWLAVLGAMTLALTVCSAPTSTPLPEPTEVAALPSPVASQPADTPLPPSPTPVPPTDTPTLPSPTAEAPTNAPLPPSQTLDSPADTPTSAVDPASLSSENCVACHTDQSTLEALAETKEVKSEATSGEG